MPFANSAPVCDANGPYLAECQGSTTDVALDGSGSSDPDGDPLSFDWSDGFVGGTATGVNPIVAFSGTGSFDVDLEVGDGLATAMCSAPVTVVDTTAPDVSASLVPAGEVEEDEGRFRVEFSCSDVCDAGSTPTAELNGIAVVAGQVVDLEADDDTEVEREDGILELQAPSFSLVAVCPDASGNVGTATVAPAFEADDDDDEDDDDDDEDDDDDDDD